MHRLWFCTFCLSDSLILCFAMYCNYLKCLADNHLLICCLSLSTWGAIGMLSHISNSFCFGLLIHFFFESFLLCLFERLWMQPPLFNLCLGLLIFYIFLCKVYLKSSYFFLCLVVLLKWILWFIQISNSTGFECHTWELTGMTKSLGGTDQKIDTKQFWIAGNGHSAKESSLACFIFNTLVTVIISLSLKNLAVWWIG